VSIPAGRKGRTIRPRIDRRNAPEVAASLADLVRTAHRKLAEVDASPLQPGRHAHMHAPADAWTRQRLPIGLLAPDIQKALLQGTAPGGHDVDSLLALDIPLEWNAQRKMLGMAG
jgi:hypothetical protein